MKNGEWFILDPISYNGRGVCARCFRQVERQFGRRAGDSEGLKQSQIIVNRVHFFHRAADEFGIAPSAKSGLVAYPIGDNALPCSGQQCEPCRAIVSGEINGAIEAVAAQFDPCTDVAKSTPGNNGLLNSRESGK